MQIPKLTDGSVIELHAKIRAAVIVDNDAARNGRLPPCGVHEYSDWRQQADEFETVMTDRRIEFEAIDWSASREARLIWHC